MIIARKDEDGNVQTLREHAWEVAELSKSAGSSFGFPVTGKILGLVHDFGKLNPAWQHKIKKEPDKQLDHSTYGAKFLFERYYNTPLANPVERTCRKFLVESMTNAILGHHNKLTNMIDVNGTSGFIERLLKEDIEIESLLPAFEEEVVTLETLDVLMDEATQEYIKLFQRIETLNQGNPSFIKRKRNTCLSPLFTHLLFSILVDADRTNAREWHYGKTPTLPTLENKTFLASTVKKLEVEINQLQKNAKQTTINHWRQKISDASGEKGKEPAGIYQLSTPVGAGKTIASFRFALEHIKHSVGGKRRIIVVLPYTAIIEQNAEDVRKLLGGNEWLLEHHGQVLFDKVDSMSIAKDNWDAPVVFTTMYQFLMTFYGGKGRYLRRLHNLMNAVVIYDEAQSVPTKSVSLFNEAVNFLYEVGNTTSLICTATPPTLDKVMNGIRHPITPVVEKEDELAKVFKRVNFVGVKKEVHTRTLKELVLKRATVDESILVILNTKKVVKDLYIAVEKELTDIPIYHLSTDMTPAHRTEVLDKVKEHLLKNEKVVCIATPLIEAGVNVSFRTVFRSYAGLDSIAQASGRCNRHGEYDTGFVYLIDHAEENLRKLEEVQIGKRITKDMMLQMERNEKLWNGYLISPSAIRSYFDSFYRALSNQTDFSTRIKGVDTKLYNLLFAPLDVRKKYHNPLQSPSSKPSILHSKQYPLTQLSSYRTVSEQYQVYDSEQIAALSPYGEGKVWIQKLKANATISLQEQKRMQRDSINLYESKMDEYLSKGIVEKIILDNKAVCYVINENNYESTFGFIVE